MILHNSVFDYTFVSLDGYHNIITKLRPQNKNWVALYISEKYDYKINEKICDLKLTNVEAVAANIKINNTYFFPLTEGWQWLWKTDIKSGATGLIYLKKIQPIFFVYL